MNDKFKVEAITHTDDGHKRLKLVRQTTGSVSLIISNHWYECDSLKSARALAHRICQNILSARERRREEYEEDREFGIQLYDDDKKWVEYKIILKDISNTETSNPIEDDLYIKLAGDDSPLKAKRPYRQIIIERYPQSKPVHGYEKGQAGRPESNRRKF